MKKKVFWNILYAVLLCAVVAAEGFAVVAVIRMNMLPGAYLAALIGVLALFALAVGLLLFWQGKKSGKGRRIAASVLAVVLTCGSVTLGSVALDIVRTLKLTSQDTLELTTREIYVLAESEAQELAGAGGYTYGYVKNYDVDCTGQVLREIAAQTGVSVSTAGYTNTAVMVKALLENRIDAIILNSGLIGILDEMDALADFSARTRVLAQIRVFETNSASADLPASEDGQETNPDMEAAATDGEQEASPSGEAVDFAAQRPFAVYISGSDSHDTEIVMNGRSDVNILAVVNPLTKQILLINTPRDYYVQNYAGGYALDKLTHCGIYGVKNSMRTLGNLYDVDIDYYVRINFSGFKKMIDALGGITVYSDYAFTAITRTQIQEGENHLNGQQALDFARERATIPGGDNGRGKHQMQVITAVIEKATSGTTIISNYSEIMDSVEGMFTMNIPAETISALMKMQLSDMASWNVVSYAVTGSGDSAECYSMPGVNLSVTRPNYTSVNKASRLIGMVFDGELLTEEVINSIV